MISIKELMELIEELEPSSEEEVLIILQEGDILEDVLWERSATQQ